VAGKSCITAVYSSATIVSIERMNRRCRLATPADVPELCALMDRAIGRLQADVLTPEQVKASRAIMGLDTQLVADGTYWLVEENGARLGCGGWSRRATLYGGDHSTGLREPRLLDPTTEAARIRAMYTNPAFARQGVGTLVLAACERAAAEAGFRSAELMATLAGERLYGRRGYVAVEHIIDDRGGAPVPLIRMRKDLAG
jgi:GNAT superfamily N-acetyltransferase